MLSTLCGFFSCKPKFPHYSFFPANQDVLGQVIGSPHGLLLCLGTPIKIKSNGFSERDDHKFNLFLYDAVQKKQILNKTIEWPRGSPRAFLLSPTLLALYESWHNAFLILNLITFEPEASISPDIIDGCCGFLPIGNQQFLSVSTRGEERYILRHDYQKREFNKVISTPIAIERSAYCLGGYNYCSAGHLSQLSENKFALSVSGHNTGYYKIFLFEKDPANDQLIQTGVITPTQLRPHTLSDSSSGYGAFTVLPGGRILTYSEGYPFIEIWEGTTKKDSWSSKKFVRSITPLPDGEHILLLSDGVAIYLMNIITKKIETLDIGKFKPWDVTISSQGQAIVRATKDYKQTSIVVIDLNAVLRPTVQPSETAIKLRA